MPCHLKVCRSGRQNGYYWVLLLCSRNTVHTPPPPKSALTKDAALLSKLLLFDLFPTNAFLAFNNLSYIYEVQLPNMKSLFQDLFVSSSIRFMTKKVCLAWFPKENKKIKHSDVSGTERNCKYELAAEELKETPSMAPSAKIWCRWIRSSLYQSYAQHLHHPSITGAADGGRMSCVLTEEVGRGGTGTGPPSWSRCKGSASSNGSIK